MFKIGDKVRVVCGCYENFEGLLGAGHEGVIKETLEDGFGDTLLLLEDGSEWYDNELELVEPEWETTSYYDNPEYEFRKQRRKKPVVKRVVRDVFTFYDPKSEKFHPFEVEATFENNVLVGVKATLK